MKNPTTINPKRIALAAVSLLLVAWLLYQIPAVNSRLGWRLDFARTYLEALVNPVGELPTPAQAVTPIVLPTATTHPTATLATQAPTPVPTPSPTPLPGSAALPAPPWEKQDWNNCGPDTLSFYLRFYGWDGDQFDISNAIKPERGDRNVNVEELVYYVRNNAGWLNIQFRVGGDIDLLKKFIAAGIPVMIEESDDVEAEWARPDDDYWAGHYLLLTGYDDARSSFISQDSLHGTDTVVSYQETDEKWQPFNRVYILVYPPGQEQTVQAILGPHWDPAYNRQAALDTAQAETQRDPEDVFAWFNLGSNLVYFEKYEEAAAAYDNARALGWPQRMLRYQFGPFFAYFHTARYEDLLAISDYALRITNNAEEAFLWKGWALYRMGDGPGAVEAFQQAYWANIYSTDAQYALEFMGASP